MERLSDAEFRRLHREHIASDWWREFRREVIRHYRRCAVCGTTQDLQIDHKRYWKDGTLIFGRETLADVRLLCADHHLKGVHTDAEVLAQRRGLGTRLARSLVLLPWRLLRLLVFGP